MGDGMLVWAELWEQSSCLGLEFEYSNWAWWQVLDQLFILTISGRISEQMGGD